MKTQPLLAFVCVILACCTNKPVTPGYYKNLYTGETLGQSDFEKFQDSIHHIPSLKGTTVIRFHFYEMTFSNDSIIQPFKYDLRIGDEYIVRALSNQKIGMEIPRQYFVSIDGDTVQVGGTQAKPTLINLWFVGCRGCVEELPGLNKLRAKYKDKVNFIAATFDDKSKVIKFLGKNAFDFKHITNAAPFIKTIETNPYPENIFIDRAGRIMSIEGGLVDSEVTYFESIIKKMLPAELPLNP